MFYEHARPYVAGPSGKPCSATVKRVEDEVGLYALYYRPTEDGKHTLSITLDGKPVEGSPFSVSVAAEEVPRRGSGANNRRPQS